MKKYESPIIQFNTLELFERIADTCWGYGHAWWTGNDKFGQVVTVEASWTSGCKGGLPQEFTDALTAANVDTSKFHNNIANTKETGFSPNPPS